MSKAFSCGNTHTDVGEIRGCSGCQANGTAARVHAGLKDSDPVEAMPGAHNSLSQAQADDPSPPPTNVIPKVQTKKRPGTRKPAPKKAKAKKK